MKNTISKLEIFQGLNFEIPGKKTGKMVSRVKVTPQESTATEAIVSEIKSRIAREGKDFPLSVYEENDKCYLQIKEKKGDQPEHAYQWWLGYIKRICSDEASSTEMNKNAIKSKMQTSDYHFSLEIPRKREKVKISEALIKEHKFNKPEVLVFFKSILIDRPVELKEKEGKYFLSVIEQTEFAYGWWNTLEKGLLSKMSEHGLLQAQESSSEAKKDDLSTSTTQMTLEENVIDASEQTQSIEGQKEPEQIFETKQKESDPVAQPKDSRRPKQKRVQQQQIYTSEIQIEPRPRKKMRAKENKQENAYPTLQDFNRRPKRSSGIDSHPQKKEKSKRGKQNPQNEIQLDLHSAISAYHATQSTTSQVTPFNNIVYFESALLEEDKKYPKEAIRTTDSTMAFFKDFFSITNNLLTWPRHHALLQIAIEQNQIRISSANDKSFLLEFKVSEAELSIENTFFDQPWMEEDVLDLIDRFNFIFRKKVNNHSKMQVETIEPEQQENKINLEDGAVQLPQGEFTIEYFNHLMSSKPFANSINPSFKFLTSYAKPLGEGKYTFTINKLVPTDKSKIEQNDPLSNVQLRVDIEPVKLFDRPESNNSNVRSRRNSEENKSDKEFNSWVLAEQGFQKLANLPENYKLTYSKFTIHEEVKSEDKMQSEEKKLPSDTEIVEAWTCSEYSELRTIKKGKFFSGTSAVNYYDSVDRLFKSKKSYVHDASGDGEKGENERVFRVLMPIINKTKLTWYEKLGWKLFSFGDLRSGEYGNLISQDAELHKKAKQLLKDFPLENLLQYLTRGEAFYGPKAKNKKSDKLNRLCNKYLKDFPNPMFNCKLGQLGESIQAAVIARKEGAQDDLTTFNTFLCIPESDLREPRSTIGANTTFPELISMMLYYRFLRKERKEANSDETKQTAFKGK